MKNVFASLVFMPVLALLLGLPGLSAQTVKPAKAPETAVERVKKTEAPDTRGDALKCDNCKHAAPAEVFSSSKDAVVFLGPPDGKGSPVEYQVFTQKARGGTWTPAARGIISKPGERQSHCFAGTAQVMVIVWCDTPFGSMAQFTDNCQ